jgi:hypothetical protein
MIGSFFRDLHEQTRVLIKNMKSKIHHGKHITDIIRQRFVHGDVYRRGA